MAETYNVYTSNLQEGSYSKIAEGLTERTINIGTDDPNAGGVKYVKVAAVNDAGEGFLSKSAKMTFIGKVPKPEILSYFRNGFFLRYNNATYASSMSLQKSVNGGEFQTVDSSQIASKFVMAENISSGVGKVTLKAVGHAENSLRSSDAIPNIVPQNFNLAGVTRSTDAGQTWNPFNSKSGFTCFAYLDNNVVIGGLGGGFNKPSNTAIHRSVDGGINWNPLQTPLLNYAYFLYLGNGVVLGATDANGIKRSTDFGLTWVDTSISSGKYTKFAYLGNNIVVVVGEAGIKRSTNGGITWGNTSVVSGFYMSVVSLGNNILLAGSIKLGIIRSTDGGITWGSTIYPADSCYCFAYLGNNTVLAAYYNEVGNINPQGVIKRSTDGGLSWSDTSLIFGNGALIVHMVYLGNNTVLAAGMAIYGGKGWGVHKSTDGGIQWNLSGNFPASGLC